MTLAAVVPTKRGALERAAGFLEHHLAEIRTAAASSDEHDHRGAERLVLDAMETAYAAGMLREMATQAGDAERTRNPR